MLIQYFIISLVFLSLGFIIGRRIDFQVKKEEKKGRFAPPPPPPKIQQIKEGHLLPRYYNYVKGRFAKVNRCTSCGIIGLYEDIHEASPCPYCGGGVMRWGAAKWDKVDGIMQWVEPENQK
jgi:predicted RNA-binding Zn-ribbon protein involved in translation (DUF1610 family)